MCFHEIHKNKTIKSIFQIGLSILAVVAITTFCVSSAINNNKVSDKYVASDANIAQKHNTRVDELVQSGELIGTPTYYVEQTQGQEITDGLLGFEFTVLDVGQGSCTLIECDGHYLLFDGGDRDTSSYVFSYLQNSKKIEYFDYVVASHYDSDHIAGLIGVIKKFPVKCILGAPYTADTKTYFSFYSACENSCGLTYPTPGDSFMLGSAMCQVVSPVGLEYKDENSYSIGLRITYGTTSFIIMGDSTKESEIESVDAGLIPQTDILVVNHHGSASSSSDEFINAVSPKAAVISVGSNNEFGHPTEDVLNKLVTVPTYRTDINGAVTFVSNGEVIEIYTER